MINEQIPNYDITVTVSNAEPEIPEFQGVYAEAVFLWANSKHSPVKTADDYPSYIKYECGILDPVGLHKKMIAEGFLEEDTVSESLKQLKANQLKMIAEKYGLHTSGTKAKLIERIMETADIELLRRICPTSYSLTEKGELFLTVNDECVQLHRNSKWMISWEEYSAYKTRNPSLSYLDIVKEILLKRASEDTQCFGKFNYLFISEIEESQKNYRKAVSYLMQTIYIDVSGISTMGSIESYRMGFTTKDDLRKRATPGDILPNSVAVKGIMQHSDAIDFSVIDKLYTWRLPMQLCEKSLFEVLINDIVIGTYDSAFYEKEMRKRYESFIDAL